MYQRIAIGTWW